MRLSICSDLYCQSSTTLSIHMYTCVHICTYVHIHVHTHAYRHTSVYICTDMYTPVCTYTHMYTPIHTCTRYHTHRQIVHTHVHMWYTCGTHMYTHVYSALTIHHYHKHPTQPPVKLHSKISYKVWDKTHQVSSIYLIIIIKL